MSYLNDSISAVETAEYATRGLGPFDTADHDPAELIALAGYYIRREAFAERVAEVLDGLDYIPGEYRDRFVDGGMVPGEYAIHRGNAQPDYAQPHSLRLRVNSLHVTVQALDGDRSRVVAALIGAGVVSGWDGDETAPDGFTEAFSDHGWISVRR